MGDFDNIGQLKAQMSLDLEQLVGQVEGALRVELFNKLVDTTPGASVKMVPTKNGSQITLTLSVSGKGAKSYLDSIKKRNESVISPYGAKPIGEPQSGPWPKPVEDILKNIIGNANP